LTPPRQSNQLANEAATVNDYPTRPPRLIQIVAPVSSRLSRDISFGITLILAFALIAMRTRDHRQAASLSTLSQATAYLIAATGPVAFGWLHDLTAGWTVPMVSLLAVTIIQGVAGLGAGREGQV
jgi:cyanate permease